MSLLSVAARTQAVALLLIMQEQLGCRRLQLHFLALLRLTQRSHRLQTVTTVLILWQRLQHLAI
jgi:hypothetical protein